MASPTCGTFVADSPSDRTLSCDIAKLCVHAGARLARPPWLPASLRLLRLVGDYISIWEPAIPLTRCHILLIVG